MSVLGHRPGWKDSCPFWPSFMTTGPFPPGSPRVDKSTHKANQSIHQAIELPAISPKPISNLLPAPSPVSTFLLCFLPQLSGSDAPSHPDRSQAVREEPSSPAKGGRTDVCTDGMTSKGVHTRNAKCLTATSSLGLQFPLKGANAVPSHWEVT